MISPSVYLMIAYLFAVLLSVAVYSSAMSDGRRRAFHFIMSAILLAADLYVLFKSLDALIMMNLVPSGIFLAGVIGSSWIAVLCMRERESGKLRFSSVVTTVGCFLLFLLLLVIALPKFRYCLGCGEWH